MADETKARHTLADMQARIARSAYDALGITAGDVGADHVRAAFLMLTKQFHPAKFARMAPDIQKLANEVFLGLRAAHDQLARPAKSSPQRSSGPIPTVKTPAPELVRTASAVRPNGVPVADPRNASGIRPSISPNHAPGTQRAPGTQPATRAPSPPLSTTTPQAAASQARAPSPPIATTSSRAPTAQPQRPSTAQPVPGQRPAAAPAQAVRRTTPAGGVPVIKQPTPAVGTARAGTAPIPPTPSSSGGSEPELAGVYDLLQKGQFEQARTTLDALIALQPRARYRALHQYSIGREAQLARRLDDARVDLLGALEIDPELQLAKTALAELFTRRK